MTKPIELVRFENEEVIRELSFKTWGNIEPGFQIDGVNDIHELSQVFDLVREAAPDNEARKVEFNMVYPSHGDFEEMSKEGSDRAGVAHIDSELLGMAIHHNITDRVIVELGISRYKSPEAAEIDFAHTTERRIGSTFPGRLTIFSEGGYDWLLRTAHQFGRISPTGNEWARYTQSLPNTQFSRDYIRKVANSAFARLAIKAAVS